MRIAHLVIEGRDGTNSDILNDLRAAALRGLKQQASHHGQPNRP